MQTAGSGILAGPVRLERHADGRARCYLYDGEADSVTSAAANAAGRWTSAPGHDEKAIATVAPWQPYADARATWDAWMRTTTAPA